ncbi:hypothetical protein HG530_006613 [Fusarium avenaceum]|nr:hypothetical protein HG530_006613 [Fusarium avenaceum]
MARFEPKYSAEIQQMMFCAGEKQDVSNETLALIEEIVRNQVVHLLTTANDLAARRGQRSFSINDIIFQIRHDRPRLARVQALIRWRAIRRAANKKSNDSGEIDFDDAEDIEDVLGSSIADCFSKKKRTETAAALLPWDVDFFFAVQPPGGASNETLLNESSKDSLERLRWADEITNNMTAEEYAKYADYRHASFTSRKKERFRKWAGIGVIAEPRKKEDILEITGFLAAEMVKKLTDMALSIQENELTAQRRRIDQAAPLGERRPLFHLALPLPATTPSLDILHNGLDLLRHSINSHLITHNHNRPTALWLPNGNHDNKPRPLQNISRLTNNLVDEICIPIVPVDVSVHPVLHNGTNRLLTFELGDFEKELSLRALRFSDALGKRGYACDDFAGDVAG